MDLIMKFDNVIEVYHERYGPEDAYAVLDNDIGYVLNDCNAMTHHVSRFLQDNDHIYDYLLVQEETPKEHVDRLWAMLPNAQRELIVNNLL